MGLEFHPVLILGRYCMEPVPRIESAAPAALFTGTGDYDPAGGAVPARIRGVRANRLNSLSF
jgi:hypothetical protein